MIYSKERLLIVISAIAKRAEKRQSAYISENPLMANASVDWDFSTKTEKAILHFCKQQLTLHYPAPTPDQAKQRNMEVISMAKHLNIPRSKARKLLAQQAI